MQHIRIVLSMVLCCCCNFVYCQGIAKGLVLEKETGEPIAGAVITFADGSDKQPAAVTNATGRFVLNNATGKKIRISYIGFRTLTTTADSNAVYRLLSDVHSLNEVVVTAQESRGLSTASTIKRHAMEHLQPSSFADLLELLPGGRASNSSLATPNTISLREVPISSKDYNTSSLGTQFVVDGAPVSTNANMQRVAGAVDHTAQQRDFTNAGLDMRTISTDDIQDVEIVRGIPSVKYGDLTSGLIKINRRKGGNDLAARFKADMSSKLFYVGKAFEHAPAGISLNLSADYLNSKADPRNLLETYQRVTFSARVNKQWKAQNYDIRTGLNLDYGGSFDDEKVDPELNHGGVDKYISKYNRYALAFNADIANKQKRQWFQRAELSVSFSFERNRTERTRLVQLDGDTPAATTQHTGESDATFIYPYTYTATHTVDGRPVSLFVRGEASFSLPLKHISNTFLIGSDFLLDKNMGEGQIFDRLHPLYPETFSRPRRFADVPASHELSLYAQERMSFSLNRHRIELEAGLRAETMPHLSAGYALSGKYYADPRINIGWTLPTLLLSGKPFNISFMFGAGKHTKFPTIDQLYPEPQYIDFVEFSYYHAQRENRRMRLQTYVVDAANPQLAAARNTKWELRGDVSFAGNRLTIIYFEEDMQSGFRSMDIFSPYIYKVYTMNGVPPSQLTTPPNIDALPYSMRSRLRSHQVTSNGSRTFKRGIEYTFASARLPLFNTRITINGAWFKTSYHNSIPVMEKPSRIINGRALEAAGIYHDDEGYIREMFNTNFTFDSDIPKLKLGISLSAQCLWFTAQQSILKEAAPQQYMDANGTIRPYTQAERQDVALRYLMRQISASAFERQTVPFSMNLNLKATKKLWHNKLMIALFVNKLWDAHPDYKRNDFIVRRYVTPYFGLETSIRL